MNSVSTPGVVVFEQTTPHETVKAYRLSNLLRAVGIPHEVRYDGPKVQTQVPAERAGEARDWLDDDIVETRPDGNHVRFQDLDDAEILRRFPPLDDQLAELYLIVHPLTYEPIGAIDGPDDLSPILAARSLAEAEAICRHQIDHYGIACIPYRIK